MLCSPLNCAGLDAGPLQVRISSSAHSGFVRSPGLPPFKTNSNTTNIYHRRLFPLMPASPEDLPLIRAALGREPTDVESEIFDNLWSEHCAYRSSASQLKKFPTTAKHVLIGPGDDAAVLDVGGGWVLTFAMESHNHPSYVDPYSGSATGVGGIVRDVLSMGTRPIALMDPLYFGPLGNEKNRYLFENVVRGIGDYGNCIGVPTVRGEVFFDDGFEGNPLVNVVCVGIGRREHIVTATAQQAGNALILMGSSTGRDGMGGASFASRDLAEDSEAADRPSVQVGDPFTEKLLIEATLECVRTGKVKACRDLGAAGLSGASSELCAKGGLGGLIYADRVHLREDGMTPREVMVSESQERMVLEVAPGDAQAIIDIAAKYDLQASVIGEVISEHRYRVTWNGEVVADIPLDALCTNPPMFEREADIAPDIVEKPPGRLPRLKDAVLAVLSSPNVASKSWVCNQYDHTVGIRTLNRMGADAAVLRLLGPDGEPVNSGAIALSCGVNPRHVFLNPRDGAYGTVLENAANIACAGARPLAVVDCLNFGDPDDPKVFAEFAGAVDGIAAACRDLDVPVVGGNVSFYNESEEHGTAIKPTPSIGMVGWVEKPENAPPVAFPANGERIFMVGSPTPPGLGGSEFYALYGGEGPLPALPEDPATTIQEMMTLVSGGQVSSCHDVSLGGLAAALSEMAVERGADIELSPLGNDAYVSLFSEAHCRWLVTVPAGRKEEFVRTCPLHHVELGVVVGRDVKIRVAGDAVELTAGELRKAMESLTLLMRAGAK